MKKLFLLSFLCVIGVCSLQAQNSVLELISNVANKTGIELPDGVTAEQVLDYCNDVIKKHGVKKGETPATFSLRSVQLSDHDKFVNRVRVPDVSKRELPKYYYLKNVNTQEYLHLEKIGDPLVTVKTPNEYSRFFFIKDGLTLGNSASFVSPYCSKEDVFYGPDQNNKWSHESGWFADLNLPVFYFNTLENGSGFYISNVEKGNILTNGNGDCGDVWTIDSEGKLVVTNRVDENAVWIAEPFYEQSLSVSTSSDTVWYVARNVQTGRFLHYNGAKASMTTVYSPDTCSLFYAVSDGNGPTQFDVKFGNFVAGDKLIGSDVDEWTSEGAYFKVSPVEEDSDMFFISQSGYKTTNDIWSENTNGEVVKSEYVENCSLWQFERISNFKEICGMGRDFASGYVLDMVYDCLDMLDSGKITPTQYYTSLIGILVSAAYSAGSYYESFAKVKEAEAVIGLVGDIVNNSDRILKEMSLVNYDYFDEESFYESGRTTVKGLATNTTSLIVNDMSLVADDTEFSVIKLAKDMDRVHTDIWQFYIKGISLTQPDGSLSLDMDENNLYSVFYNVATRMYISKPQYDKDKGEWHVSMTSKEADAGKYSVVGLSDVNSETKDIASLLEGYYGVMQFESKEVENCYLYLPSPDDIALSCIFTSNPDTVPGINWLYVSATSVIDEKVYNHAQDAVNTYPGFIQENFGLIKDASWITSNYPLEENYGNLLDNDFYTSFSTSDAGNTEGESHYLQVDLHENAVAGFHFFIKANLNSYLNVPVSITVSGSNDPENGFETLAEKIEMPNLLYDMCYFSDAINATVGAETYRYLRFTVNSVNAVETGASEREFTLSEFYIYPANEYVEDAKNNINSFLDEEYLEIEIIDPTVALMKQKAEYLLEVNKNNHAENPAEGQYSTSAYNALKDAVDNFDHTNQETVDALFNALEDFINSQAKLLLPSVCILESAWESGFASGKAVSFVEEFLQDANIWDLRQWVTIEESGDIYNSYLISPYLYEGSELLNIDLIPGWNTMYISAKDAYNICYNNVDNDEMYYLSVDKLDEGIVISELDSPATTSENQTAAWYLTPVSDTPIGDYIKEGIPDELIKALAGFGMVMAQAKYYDEGEKAGTFVYVGNNGLEKAEFDSLYEYLCEYYDKGPLGVIEMIFNGEISAEDEAALLASIEQLVNHFPNFVFFNGYFRLRGQDSGNYMVSEPNGVFSMMPADGSSMVELKSIFYTQPCDRVHVNVMSFEDGRYLYVDDAGLKYDRVSQDGNDYEYQTAFVSQTTGVAGLYNKGVNYYLIDNGSSVGVSAVYNSSNPSYNWNIEIVDELPVVISSVKFATFYCPMELQIPDGVVAYVVYGEDEANGSDYNLSTGKVVEKGSGVFNVSAIKGGILPAGTPVILNAVEAGTYYFKINYVPTLVGEDEKRATYSDNADVVNLLEGRHEATYIPKRANATHYILANKAEKGVGMYKVELKEKHTSKDGIETVFTTNSFYNNAHRAWLPMNNEYSMRSNSYVFAFGGFTTTEIEETVVEEVNETVIYDLQGRRLNGITSSGIYIVNGKCVFVK